MGSGPLTEAEAISNAAVLMFGGIETTEGMIANVLLHLLSHPRELELIIADRGLLPAAIEESLRLEPAAAVVDRYATADAVLAGTPIRAGDQVTVSIAAANRDLARLEAQVAVGIVLRLPRLRLDPRYHSAARGLVFRKPPDLRVRWDLG